MVRRETGLKMVGGGEAEAMAHRLGALAAILEDLCSVPAPT